MPLTHVTCVPNPERVAHNAGAHPRLRGRHHPEKRTLQDSRLSADQLGTFIGRLLFQRFGAVNVSPQDMLDEITARPMLSGGRRRRASAKAHSGEEKLASFTG
jgi:hypothetical protein